MTATAQVTGTRPLPESKLRVLSKECFTFFPNHYLKVGKVRGIEIICRAIQPEDEPLLLEFHKTLSDQLVHFRYFGTLTLRQRTMHERLRRHCATDYTREFAAVAERMDENGAHQVVGVARLFKIPDCDEAEFAIVISDSWQGRGLGAYLLKLLVLVGRESHLQRIIGRILADNTAMTRVCRKSGFSVTSDGLSGECLAKLQL